MQMAEVVGVVPIIGGAQRLCVTLRVAPSQCDRVGALPPARPDDAWPGRA